MRPVKQKKLWLGVFLFAALCAATMAFLGLFTRADGEMYYLSWQSAAVLDGDGGAEALEPDEYGGYSQTGDGRRYRLTARAEDLPEEGYLVLETAGLELAVLFNGEELYASRSDYPYSWNAPNAQAHIPLPLGAEGGALEVEFRVLDPEIALFPPLARVTTDAAVQRAAAGYANLYGMPAGAFALAFLLAAALFLLSIFLGKPDWPLALLVLAACALTVHDLAVTQGYYFLPPGLAAALGWQGFDWLIPALLLLYLVLRRKDGTLRLLGKVTLGAAAALLAAVLLSAWQAGRLFRYIQTLPLELSVGYFNGVLYQLTVYLVLACAGISAYQLAREVSRTRAEARALRIRGELTRKNYQELAEKNREAAGLRHEWRGQLAALQLMAEEGDLARLREKLGKLAGDLDRAVPRTYSGNLAIDAILQSAADQAERLGVAFRCHAVVPPELRIDEGDLCALLLNLLDNALEAAARTPGGGDVCCRIHFTQGFLSISCENSYDGQLAQGEDGALRTTKPDPEVHGFGLRQMRMVAEKYHSILDIHYTGERFTIQTALKL